MSDHTLDTKGLNCPMPVLKARRAMKGLAPGEVLVIEATDPGTIEDFAHFCEATGHQMLDQGEADGVFSFRIRKSS